MTIDSLINSLNHEDFKRVVVKIDAEGFEKQCLEGMREFIKRCKSLDILVTIHSKIINPVHGYTVEDFYELLKDWD
ncbi:MAG: FkbM family methyltransferase [Patescibacteria group bacterium]|nr:FkbM family methyltransferase [Patescibacteria group bacterium]MDD5294602.1 FkbM family methyltransferase [Patescibacteria group bacterium]MDD5554635.1 FkbM family methyltransferase [Patescibacteria group bacterium]